jgi:hypothetical protein
MDDLIKKYLYDILEAIAFIKEALEEIEGFSYYQSHKLFKPNSFHLLKIRLLKATADEDTKTIISNFWFILKVPATKPLLN